ncbi:HNH endonuclease [Microbacterium sp. zg.Y625]|uniref:HNH endonuclease n=1 Tax=Microbacterium jiangjiandongii TaxID=3049071 RepID=UPI00214CD518|nr:MULTISPECIES: HNH endonuclease signature motif containing protein [unclassified Microbacterium]MCR2794147.1 HNH endonuclease [Microbacterium sp. zg.Y625]WIM25559.1 DUF222 domain-containing protein [Microbacterium sp. zg-Y625]
MENGLRDIATALDVLVAAGADRPPASLTPGELIAVNDAFGALRRRVDAAFAPVAAEIARQSRAELGKDSLAKKQGHRSPTALISATTGSTAADAVRLVQVGEATAPRVTLSGERLPAKHRHVAAAVASGELGMWAASAIITLLDRVSLRADAGILDAMEQRLSAMAPGLRPDQLGTLLAHAEAHLDPDGVEPRETERRGERSLTIQQRDGMVVLTAKLDAETAAPVKAAIEGIVTGVLRRTEHADDVEKDRRSVRQMQADALADVCRHALGCTQLPTLPTATVIVRMDLDALRDGVGTATVDGIDHPLSAAAARRLAAEAEIIPCVLGGDSDILDWGRARRLFTVAQKLALGERDGGCASCGAPSARCVVHHIRWWARDGGATDLGNGILLCVGCHHRIHDDGWSIEVEGAGTRAKVWFVPPVWLDPAQTPRLGGRHRYDLAS